MTCDHPAASELPFLVNGTLDLEGRCRVEAHLADCAACRAEAELWRDVSAAVHADAAALPGVSDRAWRRLAFRHRASTVSRVAYAAALVAAQARLVRPGLWLSSAAVMAMGFVVAWVGHHSEAVSAIAPLVAAFGVSQLYGPQHDPAFELTQATPTSPRVLLLARLVLVFGYDLALALGASAAVTLVVPGALATAVIASWLAPMTFLSALALFCSVWIGSPAGITLAFGLWLLRGVPAGIAFPLWALPWSVAYEAWWTRSSWLFALAGLLAWSGIWLAGRRERRLPAAA